MGLTQTLALVAMTGLLYGTPGPVVLSLAVSSGTFGVRRSVPYLMGTLVGLAANLAIAGMGLALVFTRYPIVGTVFRYASLAYVLYLAAKLFRPASAANGERQPLRFVDGLVLNLINPKAYASALIVLAAFAETGADYASSFAWIFLVSMAVGIAVDIGWLSAGAFLARSGWSARAPRAWNAALAGLLVLSVVVPTFWT